LQRIGDKSVLPQDDDAVGGAKYEVRQEAALQPLKTAELAKDRFGFCRGDPIALMLREVVGEIGAQVLDIELCLLDRVEAGNELAEPGGADPQYDLLTGRVRHGCSPRAP